MHSRILASAALAVGLAVGATACSGGEPAPAGNGGAAGAPTKTLTLGSIVGPQTFDPAGVGEANFVPYAQAPYDSLILRQPDGSYAPMLATDWKLAADNTSITLNLRTDVTFSDGKAFDAEAAKANLERFKAGTGPLARELARLASVEAVDKDTITLKYSAPDPDIIFSLSDAAGRMASPAALQDAKGLATKPVGSGPYVMDSAATVQGSTYTFTARKDYWKPELQKFAKVVFKIFPDEVSLLNALQSKQVDAANLTANNNRKAADAAGIKHLTPDANLAWNGMIFYDRTGAIVPALGDVRVRQAMAMSFDVDTIQKALFSGTGVQNTQVFNAASPGYDKSLNDAYSYDVDKAKKLMTEAGYADGFDLTIPINANTTPAAQENFKNSLGQLNIRVTFENLGTVPQYFAGVQSGKYAVSPATLGSTPTDWVVLNNYIVEKAVWNPLHSSDPKLTALIEQYPSTPEDKRGELVRQINEFLVDNVWFDPWLWVEEQYFVATDVNVTLQTGLNVPAIYNYAPAGS
ncbi:peptide/nickel transport system substrate-binding protein [Pseudarthrobacter siccitolerans]|uniref:Peptide/nickel transport system substrate-binding protein n=1 Tax=Pseudarthrobacter siccitolerans TaxID=861266 RepID=A0ABU0PMK3_9MICC|nr:ABC transporter substrate-binding protein [Pseudarthrobacter siccitolerans]MDQ0675190.1 peptide/nickel transport system substrate-binding protein [Pseudarthrobacter siccitolerans]